MKALSPKEATRLWDAYLLGSGATASTALDTLYRSLRPPLIAFCRLKGCDPELADEIAEQAFIRLLVRRTRARRGFVQLLQKTAQNLCHDSVRRSSRALPPPWNRERSDPASAAENAEAVQAVRDCLGELAPEDRLFVSSVDLHGLSQRAAGELLGWRVAPSTIHERYRRIRAVLRRCLKKKDIL